MNYDPITDIDLPDVNPLLTQVSPVLEDTAERVSDWLLQFAHRTSSLAAQVNYTLHSVGSEDELPEQQQLARSQALAFAGELERLYSEANIVIEESSARFDSLLELCNSLSLFPVSESEGSMQVDAELPADTVNAIEQAFAGSSFSLVSDQHQEFASQFVSGVNEIVSDLRSLRSSAQGALESFTPPEGENDLSLSALSDLLDSCPVGIDPESR